MAQGTTLAPMKALGKASMAVMVLATQSAQSVPARGALLFSDLRQAVSRLGRRRLCGNRDLRAHYLLGGGSEGRSAAAAQALALTASNRFQKRRAPAATRLSRRSTTRPPPVTQRSPPSPLATRTANIRSCPNRAGSETSWRSSTGISRPRDATTSRTMIPRSIEIVHAARPRGVAHPLGRVEALREGSVIMGSSAFSRTSRIGTAIWCARIRLSNSVDGEGFET